MDTMAKNVAYDRILRVYDTMAGAQCTEEGIKGYIKRLSKDAGIKDPNAKGLTDFLSDFGSGI